LKKTQHIYLAIKKLREPSRVVWHNEEDLTVEPACEIVEHFFYQKIYAGALGTGKMKLDK
jgi:hypothetical protein